MQLKAALSIFCTLALLQAGVTAATAQAFRFDPPKPFNSNAASDKGHDGPASIAQDGKGNWVAVWHSADPLENTIDADYDILVVRSSDDGKTWTAPAPLDPKAKSDSHEDIGPAIATDKAGTWVAMWATDNPLELTIGLDTDIVFSVSKDNGATWSAPAPLTEAAKSDLTGETGPSVATDGKGGWIATYSTGVYTPGEEAKRNIEVVTWKPGDAVWSAPVRLDPDYGSERRSDDVGSVIATDGAGTWAVAWRNVISDHAEIHISVSKDLGKTWSRPKRIDPRPMKTPGARDPQLLFAGGKWMAVWVTNFTEKDTLGRDFDLMVTTSAQADSGWAAPVPLNTDAATDARKSRDEHPSITHLSDGRWVAVWSREDEPELHGRDTDLRVAVSTDGMKWSEPSPVNTDEKTDTGSDSSPFVTSDRSGNLVVVWTKATGVQAFGRDTDLLITVGRPSEANAAMPAAAAAD